METLQITCSDTQTIHTGSPISICGHLVQIYDIKPLFATIDILVDGYLIPGVGTVDKAMDGDRVLITLISKNVSAGTAIVTFATEPNIPPPTEDTTTHYLDIYVKPNSWYSVDSAANTIVTKLADINGAILNIFNQFGISDYKYLRTEILTDTSIPDSVIIRLHLQQISTASLAVPLGIYIAAIIATVFVIIILIGVITGWKFTLAGFISQISGQKYSGSDIGKLLNNVIEDMKKNCAANFPNNPVGYANCVKSGVQSVTQAGGDFFKDPTITNAGVTAASNIDKCISDYNAGKSSASDLTNCTNNEATNTEPVITDQTKNKNGGIGLGILLLAGLGILGFVMLGGKKEEVIVR